MSLTYSDYLALEALLSLQRPRSAPAEHDETLFITIHQVFELWFQQELHELAALGEALDAGTTYRAIRTLRRMLVILKTLVGQTDILETMTPTSFRRFRERLGQASGFQSFQFRELEFACGAKHAAHLHAFPVGSLGRTRLERRWREPSLFDHYLRYLKARGHAIPGRYLRRDFTEPPRANPGLQDVLRPLFLADPEAMVVTELLMDFDEGFQEWRYRHVKMVERTIGDQRGTGGSSGVEYLKRSLFKPFFPDLWQLRGTL